MTITTNIRTTSIPEYYIYYDDWTGDIQSVGRSLREVDYPYIVVKDTIAANILNGTACDSDYVVTPDLKLVEKFNFQSNNQDNDIFLIPKLNNANSDINITLYTTNNKLAISVDASIIAKYNAYKHRAKTPIINTKLEFYVVKDDTPDFLLQTIIIDLDDLINAGVLIYDVSHLVKFVAFDDICILTKQFFDRYNFQVINDECIDESITSNSNATLVYISQNVNGHLIINQENNSINITSNISIGQFAALDIQEPLQCYIVDEITDNLIQGFEIDVKSVVIAKSMTMSFDFDISNFDILYKNQKIIISKG